MAWTIRQSDTFLETFARVRSDKNVITELEKKIRQLSEDPLTLEDGSSDPSPV